MKPEMYQEPLTADQENALDDFLDSLPEQTDAERDQDWAETLADLSGRIDSFLAIRDRLRTGPCKEDEQALAATRREVIELIQTATEEAA